MSMHEDERIGLLEELLREKRRTSLAHTQYLACHREYSPGQKLYMREVHFVMAVGPGEGRTMSELARILEVTRGAVSQLAARMEKKGYICRVKAAEDKRRTLTCLTEQGRALYREHLAYDRANYQQVSQLLGDFSNEELERIREYECRVRACFTGQEDEP